jgi:hypothetical protein
MYNGEEICGGFAYYDADEVDAAIAELKQKLEDAKATAYAESVDAGMRERRLKRALWLTRLRTLRNFSVLAYFQTLRANDKKSNMDFDEMAYRIDLARVKCRAKAEEYK